MLTHRVGANRDKTGQKPFPIRPVTPGVTLPLTPVTPAPHHKGRGCGCCRGGLSRSRISLAARRIASRAAAKYGASSRASKKLISQTNLRPSLRIILKSISTSDIRARNFQAVAYARYSSERQCARSIDDQFELCRKIAKQHGYEIIEYYKDEAISGAGTLGRAGFQALMRAVSAKDRTFEAVIIESLFRMSRDLADSARDFKRIAYRQVELIDLEGPANTMSGIMNQEFRKHLGT